MSDLSLLNGVYAHVEAYAVLIDKVIERLGRERTVRRIQTKRNSVNFSLMPVIRVSNRSRLRH